MMLSSIFIIIGYIILILHFLSGIDLKCLLSPMWSCLLDLP